MTGKVWVFRLAIVLTLGLAGLCLFVFGEDLTVRWGHWWAKDACLDRGGSWDGAAGMCTES
ncbi:MAG: hypothetical protein KDK28_13030 [Maritimibacter sp.]|nr:hypothetical protein [Maritimibacter sp.]